MSRMPVHPGSSPDAPTVWQTIRRWLWRATVAGAVISIIAHVVFLAISAFIFFSRSSGSGAGATTFQLAVVTEAELAELQAADDDFQPMVPAADAEAAEEALDQSTPDMGEALAGIENLGAEGLGGAGDMGQSIGTGLGGGSGSASFFGLEAQGRRFAYIVDVSGSMSIGGRIEALRRELTTSIRDLDANMSFLVIPFSDTAFELDGRQGWQEATEGGKRWATRAIARLEPLNGTRPLGGFQIALGMRPRPDAIFFMTDGEFDPGVADELLRMNREPRVPIHCICFHSQGSEPLMRRIARDSGGSYGFVPAPGGP